MREITKKEEAEGMAKKVWHFLWNDNSIWSWIISLLLAFILVKFLFFPILSLVLQTQLPLVVIESSSMHHQGSFMHDLTGLSWTNSDLMGNWWENGNGEWYETRNISLKEAESWRYQWGMDKGDIVVVYGVSPDKLKVGDVIIFDAGQSNPIIHRIIDIRKENGTLMFSTKGDNNPGQLVFEQDISQGQILGKAVLRINKIGWIKLIFVEIINIVMGR